MAELNAKSEAYAAQLNTTLTHFNLSTDAPASRSSAGTLSVTPSQGDSKSVTLDLTAKSSTNGKLTVSYDTSVLTLASVEPTDLALNSYLAADTGVVTFAYANKTAVTGKLATLTFSYDSTTAPSTTVVTVTMLEEGGSQKNDEQKLTLKLKDEPIDPGPDPKPDPDPAATYDYVGRLQLRLSDSYLSGFSLGTPVKTLIAQIQAVNPDAAVTVTDGSGKAVSDSAVVSTGQLLTIQDAAGTYIYTCVVYGDINGDGHIGAADLLYVERHILGKLTLTGAAARAAMISSNHIGAASLLRIERHILGTNSIMQK